MARCTKWTGSSTSGPPKTAESARTIALPPFLVALLRQHLHTHPHDHVFTARDGAFLRRSNFARRAMRPAADGTTHHPQPPVAVEPVARGLTFHGLRHSHKTWLIADGIPDVVQARRLGHRIPDKIQHIYSHVAPELETRLLDALQQRWTTALAAAANPSSTTPTPTNQTPTNRTPATRTSTNWTSANWTALVTPRLALPPSTGTTQRAAS